MCDKTDTVNKHATTVSKPEQTIRCSQVVERRNHRCTLKEK